jgi:hypothetical protein
MSADLAAPASATKPEETPEEEFPKKIAIAKTITFDKVTLKELNVDGSSLSSNDYFKILEEVSKDHPEDVFLRNRKTGSDHFVLEALAVLNKVPAMEIRNNLSLAEMEWAIFLCRFFLRKL